VVAVHVPFLREVVDLLDVRVKLELVFELVNVFLELLHDSFVELAIGSLPVQSLLHRVNRSMDDVSVDLHVRLVLEEHQGQILEEERQEVVLEHRLLHLAEHVFEALTMAFDSGIRVKLALSIESDANFEHGAGSLVAEDALEVLFVRVQRLI